MLRTICLTCLVVTLTTQSETPKYLDGGLGYITKQINKKNIVPVITISQSDPSNHISQPPNSDLEAIPVSKPAKAPALQMIPYMSRDPIIVTPSNYGVTSPEPELLPSSTTTETIAVSESINAPAQNILHTAQEPEELSANFPSVAYDAFPINKEIPIAISSYKEAQPEISYQVLELQVTSAPIPEISTEASRCPFARTTEQETTSTTTTTVPSTTQITSSTTAIPVTSAPLPNCINGEVYPTDTGSCDQFLMCYNSVVVLLICPQGMGFNFEAKRCDWSQYVPACNA